MARKAGHRWLPAAQPLAQAAAARKAREAGERTKPTTYSSTATSPTLGLTKNTFVYPI